mmetsp:Transcript_6832/g.20160  ORF Transcript_6832/g.20160 Transcript_6832/m.20160 type:complete len:300 (+) Transcript_6832:159-1058(+)
MASSAHRGGSSGARPLHHPDHAASYAGLWLCPQDVLDEMSGSQAGCRRRLPASSAAGHDLPPRPQPASCCDFSEAAAGRSHQQFSCLDCLDLSLPLLRLPPNVGTHPIHELFGWKRPGEQVAANLGIYLDDATHALDRLDVLGNSLIPSIGALLQIHRQISAFPRAGFRCQSASALLGPVHRPPVLDECSHQAPDFRGDLVATPAGLVEFRRDLRRLQASHADLQASKLAQHLQHGAVACLRGRLWSQALQRIELRPHLPSDLVLLGICGSGRRKCRGGLPGCCRGPGSQRLVEHRLQL